MEEQNLAIPYPNRSFLTRELAKLRGNGNFEVKKFHESYHVWTERYWTVRVIHLLTDEEISIMCNEIGARYHMQILPIPYNSGERLWEQLSKYLGGENFIIDGFLANQWQVYVTRNLSATEMRRIKENIKKHYSKR